MYDVAIIGAGVIGASIFRELTKYNLKAVILEKENDVAMGTSRANSAIIHAGYDPKQGTLMAKYNVWGSELYEDLCKDLSVPYVRNGSLIIGFDDEDMETLKDLYDNGNINKVRDLKLLSHEEVLEMEPNLSSEVKGALYAPTGAIIGPFEYTTALVENGAENGGDVKLNAAVTAIEKNNDIFTVTTVNGEKIEAKFVINAAGLYADKIHNLIAEPAFVIKPRRGQYYILDKNEGELVKTTIFQCPSKKGKGVLISPTAHGNLLIGPDAEDITDVEDIAVTSDGLDFVRDRAAKSSTKVNYRASIRNFAGLRALSDRGDFIVEETKDVENFFDVAGMKSPGLSSAPAIALDVVSMLQEKGLTNEKNADFNPKREQIRFMELSKEEQTELIKKDPKYGRIICRCESITEGEIVDCIHRKVGATTLDGVKRRCRPGMGRCQGGFCGPRVQEILSRELGKDIVDITLDGEGSYILTEKTK